MIPVRTEVGQGYSPSAPSEWYWLGGTVRSWLGKNPPVIYCHGSGGKAETMAVDPAQRGLLYGLSQRYMVIGADLGLQAWGNDTHITRIGEAIDYLENRFGYSGRVTLVAGSMGTLGALNFTLANPDRVKIVAAVVPALDLADLNTMPAITADLNIAYPPAYNDAADGPTHSPVQYAAELPSDMPIHFWTASDDTITRPPTADVFVAARPQTGRTNLGPLGHSSAAVAAATQPMLDWLLTSTPRS